MTTTGSPAPWAVTSALDAARRDLGQRVHAADEAEDWQERNILEALAGVADMVCRIGDHTYSSHYRAEKSGPLVRDAIRVELECLRAYAGVDGDDGLGEAAEVLTDVASVVRLGMWILARANHGGAELYVSDARRIRSAVGALERWADAVCAGAVPDPVDE